MNIQTIRFDKLPLVVIDNGSGYIHLCCVLGAETILRIEAQVYDRLVKIGRVEIT